MAQTFGKLQSHRTIVRHPAKTCNVGTTWQVMVVCVIMHNVVAEYQHDDQVYELPRWDFLDPLIEPEYAPTELKEIL